MYFIAEIIILDNTKSIHLSEHRVAAKIFEPKMEELNLTKAMNAPRQLLHCRLKNIMDRTPHI